MYCDHPNCYNIALYGINNPTKCYQHKIYYMTQQYNNKKIYYIVVILKNIIIVLDVHLIIK